MATRLRDRQINALCQLLNFNQEITEKQLANEPKWKILVFDRFGQEIMFTLLAQKQWRELGVTLTLLLHSDREPIEDVPAIYFCQPTEENIRRINLDCSSGLYDKFYLNFIGQIPRNRLEDIATHAVQNCCSDVISKLFDQYLSYIALESSLFSLRHTGTGGDRDVVSYHYLNSTGTRDEDVEASLQIMVDGLFSVCVTLATVPVIRAPKGHAAEMLAKKLEKKLQDWLKDPAGSNLLSQDSFQQQQQQGGGGGGLCFHRPLLIILDRNLDLATPLHHTWTYQALVHDTLELQLNKIRVPDGGGGQQGARRRLHDLEDSFWREEKGKPFPEVADAIQRALEEYKSKESEVTRLKSTMGLDADAADDQSSPIADVVGGDHTALLATVVGSLPHLLERKKHLNLHMNVATAVLEQVKSRKLDSFFEIEEKMLSRSGLEKSPPLSIGTLIQDPEASAADKARLFLIYLLTNHRELSVPEIDSYCAELEAAGCDVRPVKYVRECLSYHSLSGGGASAGTGGGSGHRRVGSGGGGGVSTHVKMFGSLMSQGSQLVMEGVKNLVPTQRKLPVTQIVQTLLENRAGVAEVDQYEYLDPKVFGGSGSIPRTKKPFSEAIVFMVGGGNYAEYQNLLDHINTNVKTGGKRVCYGCTQLSNGTDFLNQLSMLGDE